MARVFSTLYFLRSQRSFARLGPDESLRNPYIILRKTFGDLSSRFEQASASTTLIPFHLYDSITIFRFEHLFVVNCLSPVFFLKILWKDLSCRLVHGKLFTTRIPVGSLVVSCPAARSFFSQAVRFRNVLFPGCSFPGLFFFSKGNFFWPF